MPTASIRRVPNIIESPIPLRGPIRAALTALIDDVSKSGFVAFISSIANVTPPTKGEICEVILKNSRCLFNA